MYVVLGLYRWANRLINKFKNLVLYGTLDTKDIGRYLLVLDFEDVA